MTKLEKAQACAKRYVETFNKHRAEGEDSPPLIVLGNEYGEIMLTLELDGMENVVADLVRLLAARVAATYVFLGGESFVGTFPVSDAGVPMIPEEFEPEDFVLYLSCETQDAENYSTLLKTEAGAYPEPTKWEPFDRQDPEMTVILDLINLVPPEDVVHRTRKMISLPSLLSFGEEMGLYQTIAVDEGMSSWMHTDEMLSAGTEDPENMA